MSRDSLNDVPDDQGGPTMPTDRSDEARLCTCPPLDSSGLQFIPHTCPAHGRSRPEWVKLGETLWAGEFWYSDRDAWAQWHDIVAEQIDERGAWFLVGWTSAADRTVIDVVHPDLLRDTMIARNIRGVEFWRGQS